METMRELTLELERKIGELSQELQRAKAIAHDADEMRARLENAASALQQIVHELKRAGDCVEAMSAEMPQAIAKLSDQTQDKIAQQHANIQAFLQNQATVSAQQMGQLIQQVQNLQTHHEQKFKEIEQTASNLSNSVAEMKKTFLIALAVAAALIIITTAGLIWLLVPR